MIQTLWMFLIVTLTSSLSFAGGETVCQPSARPQSQCVIQISNLRPTQFSVGLIAVAKKAKKIQKKDPSEYYDYLQRHPVPVVIGNGGQFYMIDHHHLARALTQLGKTTVFAQVVQNWNTLSTADFWSKMIANHYTYLYDQNDVLHAPSDLPRSILQLKDDPYRSLSGAVEDEGGFIKGKVYFIEFVWAQFFRSRISVDLIQTQFKEAVQQALKIAHSRAASSMPGYTPVPVDNDD